MLKKAITIILALAMMSGTSVFASNETEESTTQLKLSKTVKSPHLKATYQERYHLALSTTKTTTLTMILHVNNSVILYTTG